MYTGKETCNYCFQNVPEETEAYPFCLSAYAKRLPYNLGSCVINSQLEKYYTERFGLDELYFCLTLSGGGELEYAGRKFFLKPGGFFLIDCMPYHRYKTGREGHWKFLWVHFSGFAAREFFSVIFRDGFRVFTAKDQTVFFGIYNRLKELASEKLIANDLKICGALQELMTWVEAYRADVLPGIQPPESVDKCMKYITANYASDIDTDELCAVAGYSPSQLTRLFRKYTGCTPYGYIIDARLKAACELLKSTDDSVEYISGAVNFPSCSHFISRFRRYAGMTPGEYRKTYRQ